MVIELWHRQTEYCPIHTNGPDPGPVATAASYLNCGITAEDRQAARGLIREMGLDYKRIPMEMLF
jgi:hypothetical protein